MVVLIGWCCMSRHTKDALVFKITIIMTSDQPGLQLKVMGDGELIAVIPVPKCWNLAPLHHALLKLAKIFL